MSMRNTVLAITPEPLKEMARNLRNRFIYKYVDKHDAELSYWKDRLETDNGTFQNAFYERLMLAMAEQPTDEFLRGKIVADFGCGPRGSLAWANSALLRIGIDVLADRYADEFTENIISHGMMYVKSTENVIPLPSNFVDIVFTMNSLDHVYDLQTMCGEVVRILKPGGRFVGSFNLDEPPSPTEPQQLSEKVLKSYLLRHLEVQSYRLSEQGKQHETYYGEYYSPFFSENVSYKPGLPGILWVRARKVS
jgi:SAM-dependent methyltransferase